MDETKVDESKVDIKPIDLALDTKDAQLIIDENHERTRMFKCGLMLDNKRFSDVRLGIRNSSET